MGGADFAAQLQTSLHAAGHDVDAKMARSLFEAHGCANTPDARGNLPPASVSATLGPGGKEVALGRERHACMDALFGMRTYAPDGTGVPVGLAAHEAVRRTGRRALSRLRALSRFRALSRRRARPVVLVSHASPNPLVSHASRPRRCWRVWSSTASVPRTRPSSRR